MEEYQKRNIRKHVRSYKYMQILHGMALYAIAWHDISVSLSSVSNCLILSCLELCCVVLSCAVPHCILHGSVRCLVLNSAVHYCVVYCVLQVLYCVALRFVAVCCVLFHSSSVFSWGKHPGFGITCDLQTLPSMVTASWLLLQFEVFQIWHDEGPHEHRDGNEQQDLALLLVAANPAVLFFPNLILGLGNIKQLERLLENMRSSSVEHKKKRNTKKKYSKSDQLTYTVGFA